MTDSTSYPSVERSILVADVVASTSLYERLGDKRARQLVGVGVDAMSDGVLECGGRVVKSMGDGILACFEDGAASDAGLRMLERVFDEAVDIRVGAHHGSVIEVGGDIFGDAVNTAARIAAIARENELLVSRPLWDRSSVEFRELARAVPPVSVKGKSAPLELFSVLDHGGAEHETGVTMVQRSDGPTGGGHVPTLRLSLDGRAFELSASGALTLGRGTTCDILVAHHEVSRSHARVFRRGTGFHIEDTSTNGTHLIPEVGPSIHLLRRETALFGRGRIVVGAKPGEPGAPTLDFEIV